MLEADVLNWFFQRDTT